MKEFQPLGQGAANGFFQDAKADFRGILKHPLLPRFVAKRLLPILEQATAVSDEEFGKISRQHSVVKDYKFQGLWIADQIEGVNAFFFPEDENGEGVPTIIFRRSYLENDPFARYLFHDLMAEELAQVLSALREVPFLTLKNGSLALEPFKTQEKALNAIQQMKADYFSDDKPVLPDQVIAQSSGFATRFIEIRGNARHPYPTIAGQFFLESARSSIIQTIFEGLLYGTKIQPSTSAIEQFGLGVTILANNALSVPEMYAREVGGLAFLKSFTRPLSLKFDLQVLLERLYYRTADQFYDGLTDNQRIAFIQAVSKAKNFWEGAKLLYQEHHRPPLSQN